VSSQVSGARRPEPEAALLLRASWVLPIAAPPLRDGAVLVGPDGRIAAVGPREAVPGVPRAEVLELDDAILLPGLVNVHTHLELTGFEATAHRTGFPEWIRGIRQLKQARSEAEYRAAARRGVQDCWAAGITTIADTGDSGAVAPALAELGASGLAYQEVFGPHPGQLAESVAGLEERVRALRPFAGARVRLGVSPHAPYTVSGPLFARVAAWAAERNLPLAVHVAESAAETDFVARGRGPFAEAWTARGIPLPGDPAQQPSGRPAAPPRTPVEWLDSLGVLGPATLCIHAINLSEGDIGLLRRTGAAVAHCPVSNARHGHGSAPLRALLDAGIRVGLGTDSVASVGTLDLFAEMRAAAALAGLSPGDALALGTLGGARALGLEDEVGSLAVGKWGDLIALRSGAGASPDPLAAALEASPAEVLVTVCGGRVVSRRDPR
jgi:cytosine/adenosine deaminase-related metal-dependent hydrolase